MLNFFVQYRRVTDGRTVVHTMDASKASHGKKNCCGNTEAVPRLQRAGRLIKKKQKHNIQPIRRSGPVDCIT